MCIPPPNKTWNGIILHGRAEVCHSFVLPCLEGTNEVSSPQAMPLKIISYHVQFSKRGDPAAWEPAVQGSTAPSKPPGAEPFAPAGQRPAGGCPRDFGHLANFKGGVGPCKFSSERGQPPDF